MDSAFDELKKRVKRQVIEKIDYNTNLNESEVLSIIDDVLLEMPERWTLSLSESLQIRKDIFNSIKRLDVLQEFLENEDVTEIMINGPDSIFVEMAGSLIKTDRHFESREKLEDIIQQIVAGCNRTVNEASPIVDARLPSGERVNVVLPPIAINGPIVTIRRFPKTPITLEKLISYGSISREVADFLITLVRAKYNIFISGGTGSGKTTFLNALSQFIPTTERIITIEDSAELQILKAENLVKLETRNKNSEGCEPITIRDLIRSALRMRPERIVVGEVRGAEALDMLQAMNTGHDGSLSTGHGNSPKDMIARLETMVLMGMEIPVGAIRGQIAGGIDIFVHLSRMRDRSRKVTEIAEIVGFDNDNVMLSTLYKWNGEYLEKTGDLQMTEKLEKNG